MSDRSLRVAVALLALTGLGIAAYLTYTRYAHATIVCTTGGCETVQSSKYAEILGVPVAVLGLVGYAGILATAFFRSETARVAGAALALGGLVFSVYLVFVQLFAIEAFCVWCLASDLVMLLLVAATAARLQAPARNRS